VAVDFGKLQRHQRINCKRECVQKREVQTQKMVYDFKKEKLFTEIKKGFLVNQKYFRFDHDFQSYQIPKNRRKKNVFQKIFSIETNGT
jgi:hypothetical protein